MQELTDQERALLDFERAAWQLSERKNGAIRAQLSIAPSTYYRTLHALVGRPEAMEYDPLTVLRIRKRRGLARRARHEGRQVNPPGH
jgi:hypothetical protein